MIQKLESLRESLSTGEQERLTKHLTPCIKERQNYLSLLQAQAAESMQEKELLAKRSSLVGKKDKSSKTKLAELDKQLEDIRRKLHGHAQQHMKARNTFSLRKESFARSY
jgi:hypothetical protein